MEKISLRETKSKTRSDGVRRLSMTDRAAAIRDEMAAYVMEIGGRDRRADAAIQYASRLTGLSTSTIKRLRWRLIKRIPADVADAVREAKAKHDARIEALARHDALFLETLRANDPHLGGVGSYPRGDTNGEGSSTRRSVAVD
ncbi:hypothetical protein [Acuticoccus sediminis]|uniref:hypothetical protein n=1 Tax=Acuticoccus sediminis TaxID=2184697 RepID=UPI001CFDDC4B|nr:hypothetical protein [Acuticoccus sediminis]